MLEKQKPFAFVVMPFDSKYDDLYQFGIKGACESIGVLCERCDEQNFEEHIVEHIYKQIEKADVVIAELTEESPNVYYELGFARALRKRIVSLARRIEHIPFDLKSYPHIIYGNSISSLNKKLTDKLTWAIETPAVTDANLLKIYEQSADIQSEIGELIEQATQQILFRGVHFNISVSDRRSIFLKKLKEGVNLHFIILDPDSESVDITAESYNMRPEELKAECMLGIEIFKGFLSDYEDLKRDGEKIGDLKIFLASDLPRARFYLFDPQSSFGIVIFTPYVDQLRSSHSPSYAFKAPSEVAQKYIQSCSQVANKARKLTIDV